MPQPQTMLQLSGRAYAPAKLANATLIVIDVQEEYRSGVLGLPGLPDALGEIELLLGAARQAGTPIVHIHHLGISGGLFDPQDTRGQIMPEAAPLPEEITIPKRMPNAFSGTDLHEQLQQIGRLDLIICGFMTHSSISTTVRAAKDYGYRCTVIDRACATRDLPQGDQILPADAVHRMEIAILADNFAVCIPDTASLCS